MGSVRTVSVCLVFLLPFMSSAQNECQLTIQTHPECTCSGSNLTCSGYWPTRQELQEGANPSTLLSLTITDTVKSNLSKCDENFGTLTNLVRLDLSRNQIKDTRPRSFTSDCFPNLEQLVLDDNALRLKAHTTFNGLTMLRELSLNGALDRNQSVSSQLTHTLTKSVLPSLEVIMLNDNYLGDLSPSTFDFSNSSAANPSRLTTVQLRNSYLGMVNPLLFQSEMLPDLTFVDLSMNNITSLPKENLEVFEKFSSLTVNLTGNPFTCNCNLEDLLVWLNTTNVTVIDPEEMKCSKGSFSDAHVGKSILLVDPMELDCQKMPPIHFDDEMKTPYILLIAVLSIIGLLALIILFMRRKEIVKFCNQMKTATKETFDTHHTSYVYSDITRATRDTPEHSAVEV